MREMTVGIRPEILKARHEYDDSRDHELLARR